MNGQVKVEVATSRNGGWKNPYEVVLTGLVRVSFGAWKHSLLLSLSLEMNIQVNIKASNDTSCHCVQFPFEIEADIFCVREIICPQYKCILPLVNVIKAKKESNEEMLFPRLL